MRLNYKAAKYRKYSESLTESITSTVEGKKDYFDNNFWNVEKADEEEVLRYLDEEKKEYDDRKYYSNTFWTINNDMVGLCAEDIYQYLNN